MITAPSPREAHFRARGRELLDLYAPLVSAKARVREIVESDQPLSQNVLWELDGYIRQSSRKIVQIWQRADAATGGVDWPEDHVAHAVRTLTALDDDRGEYANGVGWNPRECAAGHWCCAALDTDRDHDKAVALARTMVGQYREQLQRPEVRHAYPLPEGWEISK